MSLDTQPRIYETAFARRIVHGIGSLALLPSLLDTAGATRVLIASTRSVIEGTDLIDRVRALLGDRVVVVADPIGHHSPIAHVERLEEMGRDASADALISVGGSSVADAAKIAALHLSGATPMIKAVNGVVTQGGAEANRPVSLVMIPTTLSAGEFTSGAGMTDGAGSAKVVTLDDRMFPAAVILDPSATLTTPMDLWTSSGIKALDHAVETIWGRQSHPVGDAMAMASLSRLARDLPRTYHDPGNLEARLSCQVASWMSVASMKNTSLHLSHVIEHNMGSYWGLSHGLTSCVALPTVMRYMAQEDPTKTARVAEALLGSPAPSSDLAAFCVRGADWLEQWIASLGLPTKLREVVAGKEDFDAVATLSVEELRFFGYVPEGGVSTIKGMLEEMW